MTQPIVLPGIFWQANSYIFDDLLIDAGIAADRLEPYKDRISRVVITHGHYDHIAHVREIVEICHAELCIGEYDAEFLCNGELSLCGVFHADQPSADSVTLLHDGDTVGDFTVYHTPGHTRGGICLFRAEDGTLVSGDTVFAGGDYGRYDFPTGSYDDMRKSLIRLAELPVTSIWCGHGTPAVSGGSAMVKLARDTVMQER